MSNGSGHVNDYIKQKQTIGPSGFAPEHLWLELCLALPIGLQAAVDPHVEAILRYAVGRCPVCVV